MALHLVDALEWAVKIKVLAYLVQMDERRLGVVSGVFVYHASKKGEKRPRLFSNPRLVY